jgi:hypothetical protein
MKKISQSNRRLEMMTTSGAGHNMGGGNSGSMPNMTAVSSSMPAGNGTVRGGFDGNGNEMGSF